MSALCPFAAFSELLRVPTALEAFGLAAQGIFMARFLVQWLMSEKHGRSVIPLGFWYLSLAGAVLLLAYFLLRGERPGALGQITGIVVYVRNLMLIARRRRTASNGFAQGV